MKILIVSSTKFEIAPFFKFLKIDDKDSEKFFSSNFFSHQIDILITGIGAFQMIYNLTKHLIRNKYDLLINAGFAGSFSDDIQIGDVVNVYSEEFGDFGVDDKGVFRTMFEIGLVKKNDFPFIDGKLLNLNNPFFKYVDNIKSVKGLTLNTVSGDKKRIEQLKKKFSADVETMEGAGFFFVALKEKHTFLEIRSISNAVEPRDKGRWQILKAQLKLTEYLKILIYEILTGG